MLQIKKAIQKRRKVRESNKMINSKEKRSFTALEYKMILFLSLHVDEDNFEDSQYITAREILQKPMGKKLSGRDYQNIHKACDNLSNAQLYLETTDKNGDWDKSTWINVFSYVSADRGKGEVSFRFTKDIKPHIINLKNNFTSFDYNLVQNLSSEVAIRIYQLLIQGRGGFRSREIELQWLRELLALNPSDTYLSNYSEMKRRVLVPSVKQINQHTDIECRYEISKKEGKKVTHVKFYWRFKEATVEYAGVSKEVSSLIVTLSEAGLEHSAIIAAIKAQHNKDIDAETIEYFVALKNGKIQEPAVLAEKITNQEKQAKVTEEKHEHPKKKTKTKQPQQNTQPQQGTISFETKDANTDRQKRLFVRLTNFGLNESEVMKIVKHTQATKESGIWKILYDFNLKVKNHEISNPPFYLKKVIAERYDITF